MFKRFIEDIKKYYGYEVRAAKSALKTEVDNSYLNWIWWILDPLFTMLIYYLIFGVVFKGREEHFTAFLFIGQTVWGFFNKNVQQSVKMIKRNKSIVSKVYLPKFVLLISNMMVNGFKMMFSAGIVVILMIALRVELSWYVLCFIPILLVLVLITFAVSVNLMHFGVFIEDLGNVVGILMQLMFYMSGIMFNISTRVGELNPEVANMMIYGNPVALIINNMRNVLIYQTAPDWGALAIWSAIALVFSVIGVRTIYKNENSYVKVI